MSAIQHPYKTTSKIGRNDPCLCGSGKKYKKCCLPNSENFEGKNESFHDEGGVLQRLGDKVKNRYKDSEITVQTAEELGLTKMSEIILEFAEELLENAKSNQEKKDILTMAIVAWNIAVMSDTTGLSPLECIEDFLKTADIEEGSEEEKLTATALLALIAKKQALFPDIRRVVIDFEIETIRKKLHLNVVSTEVPLKNNDSFFSKMRKKQGKKQIA